MNTHFQDVIAFHEKYQLPPNNTFFLPNDYALFRIKFLEEELEEYVHSCKTDDLATAIDSLIDLVYVVCGCVYLHGITNEQWQDHLNAVKENSKVAHLFFDEPWHPKVQFLTPEINVKFTRALTLQVKSYADATNNLNAPATCSALSLIYTYCLAGATAMGVTDELWQLLWNDVQRANMSKVRVLRSEDSKRGSTYDVRKPDGWIGPRIEELLAPYV